MAGDRESEFRAFQEMYAGRVEGIPFDVFVPVLVELCRSSGDPWEDSEIGRANTLRTIPYVMATCKDWRDMVSGQLEYAALRLAEWELPRVTLPRGVSADDFLVGRFDHNVGKPSKSWELVKPMSEHLRTAPLAELSALELQSLVSALSAGWGQEATVTSSTAWKENDLVWVTPAMRE